MTCPHVWRVDDWTRDPETGLWVHADPACMKPSPFATKKPRRMVRTSSGPTR